jgi:hypothetical protein
MCGAIDSAGEARHDDEVVLTKVMSKTTCEAAGGSRGVAGTDDGDALPVEQVQIAFCHEQRRRILELGQQPRVEPLAKGEVAAAEFFDPCNFSLGVLPAAQRWNSPPSAACEVGDRSKRCRRRSESYDELAKGHGADPRRAQQSDAVD